MDKRLQSICDRYKLLEQKLCDPKILSDPNEVKKYSKERAELSSLVEANMHYLDLKKQQEEMLAWLQEENKDKETLVWIQTELDELEKKQKLQEKTIQQLLIPKDPYATKNVILEVRGAAGGDEAALFANDLYRMYVRYAERKAWKVELIGMNSTELGGFKEAVISIQGRGVYQKLKYENGAHRVQRIPSTESGGRIHTSTATVVVLPEAEEVEIEIADKDLRIDTFCSSGPGGQSVNTTKSAVRVTHLPTGLVASCQDEKSQNMNKAKALRVLRARLYDRKKQEEESKRADERRSAIGTGDRSERIRTYNFPQGRVTDHRIGLTIHRLEQILDGDIDEIISTLMNKEQSAYIETLDK